MTLKEYVKHDFQVQQYIKSLTVDIEMDPFTSPQNPAPQKPVIRKYHGPAVLDFQSIGLRLKQLEADRFKHY